MRAVDIIIKKRDGEELTRDEIRFFVAGFTRGTVTDYQASAWAMAVLLKGMTDRETTQLTLAMADSGEKLDLSGLVDLAHVRQTSAVRLYTKGGLPWPRGNECGLRHRWNA